MQSTQHTETPHLDCTQIVQYACATYEGENERYVVMHVGESGEKFVRIYVVYVTGKEWCTGFGDDIEKGWGRR